MDDEPQDAVSPRPRQPRKRAGRTWAQRGVLTFNLLLVAGCLAAALAIFVGQKNIEDVQRVEAQPAPELLDSIPEMVVESLTDDTTTTAESTTTTTEAGPTTTLGDLVIPPGPVEAENFLMTGSDSRDCIDPNSPYAGAFLGGEFGGSRPDTIMLLRLEPSTGRAAILSFPRDLWVPVAGTNRKAKINTTFDKNDPTGLIATIESYFKMKVDHYVNIDFCVFKDLVDAVGGVSVPFLTPVRDKNTGLLVEDDGCYKFNGDHTLAYVRSRHIQYQDDKGLWHSEGTADIGRIRRQQDFLRRVMQEVRSKGVLDLRFVKGLVDSFQRRVEVDLELTANDVLRLANAMKDMDPATTRNFIVEGRFSTKGNTFVIEPSLSSDRMKQILRIFRGEASIAEAPEEQVDPIVPDDIGPTTPDDASDTAGEPTTTLEPAEVGDNVDTAYGGGNTVVPDKFAVCRDG